MTDKRQNIRWKINKRIDLNLMGDKPLAVETVLDDISIAGARLSLKERLPQEEVNLFGLKAAVVWRRETQRTNTYGLSFRQIGEIEKNRIYAFVYSNFPDDIKEPPWRKR